MKLGFIGLGRMGRRMAHKLGLEKHELVVWNRSPGPCRELLAERRADIDRGICGPIAIAGTLADLIEKLPKPCVIWAMLPAGEPTETILNQLADLVEPDDILIDGGNSHFKDTEKRYTILFGRKIRFLGIGVSGGIIAEKQGYPLMVGGDRSAYDYIQPVLASLARPEGGYDYFGTGGAGHFVKMVHNGIEYGIMQSLGEGFAVLQKAPYRYDLLQVARLYQKGTLVSGFMLDRAVDVFEKGPDLTRIEGVIAESGEARWMIDQAQSAGVEVDIIRRSLEYRRNSLTEEKIRESFTAKFIAALRHAFGGHDMLSR
jgi:6-phosphogluconate dehydrogenase